MKADTKRFREILDGLPKTIPLEDKNRALWTKFAFHFTDVRNAAKILADGEIKCRERLGPHAFTDCASPRVIAQTETDVKRCVRLYFRPRTPTQYRSEGIRPKEHYWEGSHCPVPVFLLFDLVEILSLDDSKFSDGNLASLGFDKLCNTAEEFARFDFRKIYHDSWVSEEEKRNTVAHQNAEIVVPNRLGLEALKIIYCRSVAERETLLYLLPPTARSKWSNRIGVASATTFFYRKWLFVESASLSPTGIQMIFSPDATIRGPFNLRITRKLNSPNTLRIPGFSATANRSFPFKSPLRSYSVELYLDDCLAFASKFEEKLDIPF